MSDPDRYARELGSASRRRARRPPGAEAERHREYRKRQKEKHPPAPQRPQRKSLVSSARQKLRYAVKVGKVQRPNTCEKCGLGGPIHAHHHDYNKPLDVLWLCQTCHGLEHRAKPSKVCGERQVIRLMYLVVQAARASLHVEPRCDIGDRENCDHCVLESALTAYDTATSGGGKGE